jgi:hypothetical protein
MRPIEASPVEAEDQDRRRVAAWLGLETLRLDGGTLPDRDVNDLLHAWETATVHDGTYRIRLTHRERSAVRELVRRAIVERGGSYETTSSAGPYKSARVLILADASGVRVTLPGG